MTLDSFITYFLILFIATITPGPNMLLAINHGINYGLARTIYSCIGNLTGNLLMAIVSILGLGAILITSGFIFNIIKWIGFIYLVFIGLKVFFEPVKTDLYYNNNQLRGTKKKYSLFLDGFLIAIGNPKGILFFTALFPQFINIKHATTNLFLLIFITLAIIAFGCYMLYAVFGVRLNQLFKSYSFRKIFNRITGSILIGSGLTIVISKK